MAMVSKTSWSIKALKCCWRASKYKAVYVELKFGDGRSCVKTIPKKMLLYDLRQHHVDMLRYYLGVYDWGSVTVNDQFLHVVKFYIHLCKSVKTVRIGTRDPTYITPLAKHLLHKRNKLRRLGFLTTADELACKINDIIAGNV
jgi:hypothetical protein